MNAARRIITDNPIRVGRTWLFPDGTRLPVVAGGDETADDSTLVLPATAEELSDRAVHTDDDLVQLEDDIVAEFDRLHDEGTTDLARMTELADALDRVHTEQNRRRDEDQATADAVAELATRVHGEAPTDEADGDDPDGGGDDPGDGAPPADPDGGTGAEATPPTAPEPVTAGAGVPAARPRASASGVARRVNRPNVPTGTSGNRVVITAAADLPNVGTGAVIPDTLQLAEAMNARAAGLNDGSGRVRVATFNYHIPPELDARGPAGLQAGGALAVLDRACDQRRWNVPGRGPRVEALVAAGGWCTPSVNMYDLVAYDGATGLIDLPGIGIDRGGINVPGYIEIDAADTSLWRWSEAQDLAVALAFTDIDIAAGTATATTAAAHNLIVGNTFYMVSSSNPNLPGKTYTVLTVPTTTTLTFATTAPDALNATGTGERRKGCIRITCPTWTEYRLEAFGLCIEHGNLMDQTFPELTRRWVDAAMNAHMHRMSRLWIDTIRSTTHADAVNMGALPTDMYAEVMSGIELSVEDYRSQHKFSDNVIIECLLPVWLQAQIRANLAQRAGVDNMLSVTDAQINAAFAARNVRAQFLEDYQPMWNGTRRTDWPVTAEATIYPAGDFAEGNGGNINLGVVRDSRLNATNDFTAAWTEDFRLLVRRGPKARVITIDGLRTTGVTG